MKDETYQKIRDIIIKEIPEILELKKDCILESECIACCKQELWKIIDIKKEKYLDGIFDTFELRAIKNCISDSVRTNLKNCPSALFDYKIIGRDVTLEDILFIIGKKRKEEIREMGMTNYKNHAEQSIVDDWDFYKDLKSQSQEFGDYLFEMLNK